MTIASETLKSQGGVTNYFTSKIEEAELLIHSKTQNLRRLEAQRNALNAKGNYWFVFILAYSNVILVRLLREELQLLQEPGSYVGEVVKVMDKTKILVKVQPEGKFIVDYSQDIKVEDLKPSLRVALRSDSYTLHKILLVEISFIFSDLY